MAGSRRKSRSPTALARPKVRTSAAHSACTRHGTQHSALTACRALRVLQVDATKRMGVELDDESVADGTVDIASVARDSMEATGFPESSGRGRLKGCFSCDPILIRSKPGGGKTWSLSLWANLIAARCAEVIP